MLTVVAAWIRLVALHVLAQQLALTLFRVLRQLPAVVRRLLRARAALALEMRDEVGLDARAIRVGRRSDGEERLAAPERIDAAPFVRGVLDGCRGARPLRAPQRHSAPGDATVVPQRRRSPAPLRYVSSAGRGKDYAIKRSTYRAMRSTSRFTRAPAARRPRVVTSSVCGMSCTSKASPWTWFTVRLTPSMQIEPLRATYLANPLGRRTWSTPSLNAITSPTPSTWPATKWPPR